MYLIDTNIWLELLLEQERADEVKHFFQNIEARYLAITEFSVYSIGIVLSRLKKYSLYGDFLSDTVEDSGIGIIRLSIGDLKQLQFACEEFQLDFDDAYQYVAAEKYNMDIVSFDKDFNKTERGTKTPTEAMDKEV